jgi:adenosylcobyric acid synthase
VRVAPFKAQNMSNNSMVCRDGAEIGRAQWVQARACRAEPEAAMNPVLLKPGSDHRSHVVLMGRPWGELRSGEFATGRTALAESAFRAFADLSSRYDVVIAEGAGSPAEINLRAGDYVNMGLARAADLPVVVVGDIDRGGVLAAMYGTLALLDDDDQAHIRGWVVNKFRGDLGLLQPGLRMLEERSARPVLGVLPYLQDVWLDGEDSLALAGWSEAARGPAAAATLSVAVVRFPRISNATDVDALAAEPGVDVLVTIDPAVADSADLLVLPGSRSTASDLAWLRERGLADVVARRVASGRPVLGVCGGYQMLGHEIEDDVEGRVGVVPGLGHLPVRVEFGADKVLARPSGSWSGHSVDTAYEIHHGIARRLPADDDAVASPAEPLAFLDGWNVGPVWGTMWHGAFESDDFRRAWLSQVARAAGSHWQPSTEALGFTQRRERMLDTLADALEEHVDVDALLSFTRMGATP